MQIYVATFGLLYKEQLNDERGFNNNTISAELHNIFKIARELLCSIEDFVNSTNTERISTSDWLTRHEMKQILNFQNLTDKLFLHRMYAKGRFQGYIKKLHDRIVKQILQPQIQNVSQGRYPKVRALKHKKPTNRRKNALQNGSASKKVHKIRTTTTKKPRAFMKKRKNQKQRQSSTMASPIMQ